MDREGNILGDNTFGDWGLPSAGYDIAVLPSGKIAMAGMLSSNPQSDSTFALAAIFETNLVKMDQFVHRMGQHTRGLSICATADSGFVIAKPAGAGKDPAAVIPNGDTLWTTTTPSILPVNTLMSKSLTTGTSWLSVVR